MRKKTPTAGENEAKIALVPFPNSLYHFFHSFLPFPPFFRPAHLLLNFAIPLALSEERRQPLKKLAQGMRNKRKRLGRREGTAGYEKMYSRKHFLVLFFIIPAVLFALYERIVGLLPVGFLALHSCFFYLCRSFSLFFFITRAPSAREMEKEKEKRQRIKRLQEKS